MPVHQTRLASPHRRALRLITKDPTSGGPDGAMEQLQRALRRAFRPSVYLALRWWRFDCEPLPTACLPVIRYNVARKSEG